jgi:hypothetical protein
VVVVVTVDVVVATVADVVAIDVDTDDTEMGVFQVVGKAWKVVEVMH